MRHLAMLATICGVMFAAGAVNAQSLQERLEGMRAAKAQQVVAEKQQVRQSKTGQAIRSSIPVTMPVANGEGMMAKDAFTWLSNVSGLAIVVNWEKLKEEGVDPEQKVVLAGNGQTVGDAIEQMARQLGPNEPLIWEVTPWYVEVMTKSMANQRLVVAIYPIGDLLVNIPNFTDAPDFDLVAITKGGQSRQIGGGSSGSGAAGSPFKTATTADTPESRAARGQQIVEMIRETVEPEIWKEAGGTATIVYYNGNLVVRAPAYVQRQIGGEVPTFGADDARGGAAAGGAKADAGGAAGGAGAAAPAAPALPRGVVRSDGAGTDVIAASVTPTVYVTPAMIQPTTPTDSGMRYGREHRTAGISPKMQYSR